MLVDLDKIRSERRKAKANRNKYVGTGNDGMSGGRYGGFGGDNFYGGGGSTGYGGSGGGGSSGMWEAAFRVTVINAELGSVADYYNGGGGSSSSFRDDTGSKTYDDYDAGDDEDKPASRHSSSLRSPVSSPSTSKRTEGSSQPRRPEPKEKAPEKQTPIVDLLGDWENDTATTTTTTNQNKALPAVANNDRTNFDLNGIE
jgi:epsin